MKYSLTLPTSWNMAPFHEANTAHIPRSAVRSTRGILSPSTPKWELDVQSGYPVGVPLHKLHIPFLAVVARVEQYEGDYRQGQVCYRHQGGPRADVRVLPQQQHHQRPGKGDKYDE